MKRSVSLLLCVTLLLIFAGVFSSCKADFTSGDKPLVVTTIFAPYDFAKAVGGDRIEAHVLVTVTDSHSFSPTAADMALIEAHHFHIDDFQKGFDVMESGQCGKVILDWE